MIHSGIEIPNTNPVDKHQEFQKIVKPIWLGREIIIEPKNPYSIAFRGVIAVTLVTVGILLLSTHPTFGTAMLLFGGYTAYHVVKRILEPDRLEEALKYLANVEDLDTLPEKAWSLDAVGNINYWNPSDMTHDIMALKEGSKTIAVAFKCENDVKICAFKQKVPDLTKNMPTSDGRDMRFQVHKWLWKHDIDIITSLFPRLQ